MNKFCWRSSYHLPYSHAYVASAKWYCRNNE